MQIPQLEQTVSRAMYGGAIELDLPPRFADVSDFRPVPDHQEVWADASEDQSLVVEIVEHNPAVTDADCARHYWDDQVACNESTSNAVQSVQTLDPSSMPHVSPGTMSYACLVTGTQAVSKARQAQEAANQVAVHLAVLRMPTVRSDVLMTLNSPVVISQASQAAQHAGAGLKQRHAHAEALMRQILHSFAVMNWSLFG